MAESDSSAACPASASASWYRFDSARTFRPYTTAPMATAGTTSSITPVSFADVMKRSTSPPTTWTPFRSAIESWDESSPWRDAVSDASREVRSPVRWPSKKATSCTTSESKSCSRTRFTPRSPARLKR
jgi:hypothetical protein